MNSFRRAPWYLKLLLIFLPFDLCGKLAAYAISFYAVATVEYTSESVNWLAINAAEIAFVTVVLWFTWRPQPVSRWLVAAFISLAIVRTIYPWLYPSGSNVLLSRGGAAGAPNTNNMLILLVLISWWGYVCVFCKRSLAYYNASKAAKFSSGEDCNTQET